jgi:hypothetical protein
VRDPLERRAGHGGDQGAESLPGSSMEQQGGPAGAAAGGDRVAAAGGAGVPAAGRVTGEEEESPACSPLRLRPVSRSIYYWL